MNGEGATKQAAHESGAADDTSRDPLWEIVALARRSNTKAGLMAGVLRVIGRHFQSPYAAMHIRYSSEVLQDECHYGPQDPSFWKSTVQDFLTDSLAEPAPRARTLRSRKGSARVALLSSPVFDVSGPAIGAISLVATSVDESQVPPMLARLESATRLASFAVEFLGGASGGGGSGISRASAQARAKAAACETTAELAYAITNELRNKLACEQVALGMVHRGRVRIISISGLDDVKKQSPGVVAMTGAMEECLDAGCSITFQRTGGWSGAEQPKAYALHKQWHAAARGDAVASIPLCHGDDTVAILSIRQRADEPFTAEFIEEIRKRVEPFAAGLRLTARANRSLVAHVRDIVWGVVDSVLAPGHWGRKIGAAAIVALTCWFAFGRMAYHVGVDAVVAAAEVRHVACPSEGLLVSASAVEGDRVSAGDVLCRFDDRDLTHQRDELLAEIQVYEREMDIGRANDSPYEVQLARAQRSLAEARLAIVNARIERTVVRAPFDGFVVSGDLRKRIGGMMTRGDPLYQVAPLREWTLQLDIPDAASADIEPSLTGMFASYARPDQPRPFKLTRVDAGARQKNERNVFVAEADLADDGSWLRPGMEGVARIEVGRRPVWWIALHRVIDYLRINFWI